MASWYVDELSQEVLLYHSREGFECQPRLGGPWVDETDSDAIMEMPGNNIRGKIEVTNEIDMGNIGMLGGDCGIRVGESILKFL